MELETLRFETSGRTGRLVLNRPQVLNAFNNQAVADLNEITTAMLADDELRVVLVTGDRLSRRPRSRVALMGQAGFGHRFTPLPELVTPLCGVTGLLGALRHGPGCDAERHRMRYTAERCNEWCHHRGGRNNDRSRQRHWSSFRPLPTLGLRLASCIGAYSRRGAAPTPD